MSLRISVRRTTCMTLVNAMFRSVKSTVAVILLLAGAITAAANIWGVGPIKARLHTHIGPQVAHVLGREV